MIKLELIRFANEKCIRVIVEVDKFTVIGGTAGIIFVTVYKNGRVSRLKPLLSISSPISLKFPREFHQGLRNKN